VGETELRRRSCDRHRLSFCSPARTWLSLPLIARRYIRLCGGDASKQAFGYLSAELAGVGAGAVVTGRFVVCPIVRDYIDWGVIVTKFCGDQRWCRGRLILEVRHGTRFIALQTRRLHSPSRSRFPSLAGHGSGSLAIHVNMCVCRRGGSRSPWVKARGLSRSVGSMGFQRGVSEFHRRGALVVGARSRIVLLACCRHTGDLRHRFAVMELAGSEPLGIRCAGPLAALGLDDYGHGIDEPFGRPRLRRTIPDNVGPKGCHGIWSDDRVSYVTIRRQGPAFRGLGNSRAYCMGAMSFGRRDGALFW
jgi:hypothetical protein